MLPNVRLIAAAFLCGFVLMFAGLRLATSLHDIHEAPPTMMAQAAPVRHAVAEPARDAAAVMPVLFDLRYFASTAALEPTPTNVPAQAADTDETPEPAPAAEEASEDAAPAAAASEAEPDDAPSTLAAIDPQSVIEEAPADPPAADASSVAEQPEPAAPDLPATKPELRATESELPAAQAVEPEPTAVTAVDTQATEPTEPTEPADPAAARPSAAPASDTGVAAEPEASPEPATAATEPERVEVLIVLPRPKPPFLRSARASAEAATAHPDAPAATGDSAPEQAGAKPAPHPEVKSVRRKRTLRRRSATNSFDRDFGFPFGKWPR